MITEEFVINLGNAKRLNEIGINQDSLFYWECNFDTFNKIVTKDQKKKNEIKYQKEIKTKEFSTEYYTWYSAYTLQELLYQLPKQIIIDEAEMTLLIFGDKVQYVWEDGLIHHSEQNPDIFEALYKMIIYLRLKLNMREEK